ncbi:Trans-hexaprenyltranstransferase [Kribbella flavida DSM 17836]|uniref:Trans-hexaprenyltranstransferase n=1 Tax=Kribbella flavida (strain DSM 17836 / JCM 10339 / NBRC 14399) TaxID=479435 RepID=D2PVP7_KRIFD|nr:polyprenyl synthetase family protein [Kribbella flavida]ADB35287.1 Trans-hexaprenyltranstransferase [Kribbella flavida DSM 17836]
MSPTPLPAQSLGFAFADEALESRVRAGLERVEQALRDSTQSEAPFVTQAAQHVMVAGGKRFRPLLVLLAAEFGPRPTATEVVDAAVVVELTHVATLHHDDVMDEAALRRGSSTANAAWDNSVAILAGDWLFAKASDLVASLGPEAVRIQARTFGRLVEGQIRETLGVGEGQDPLAHYLSVVADKTGSLIATSALFGARFAGAPAEVQEALRAFGEEIGTAFQLADDILDVTSESGQSGKTPGTDLREGVPTLPVLIFRAQADPAKPEDARLLELLDSDLTDDARLAETLAALRVHPSLQQAEEDVRRRADDARKLLTDLPEGIARSALESLCDLVVTRSV